MLIEIVFRTGIDIDPLPQRDLVFVTLFAASTPLRCLNGKTISRPYGRRAVFFFCLEPRLERRGILAVPEPPRSTIVKVAVSDADRKFKKAAFKPPSPRGSR